jgi:hypothetical protein
VTTSTITAPRLTVVEAARTTRGSLLYILCLTSITTGYYLYWWLWKLKAYYIGWFACFIIVMSMVVANRLRMGRIVRDMVPVLVWYAYLTLSALWSPSPSTTLYLVFGVILNPFVFAISYAWAKSTSRWALAGFFEYQVLLILPIIVWDVVHIGELYDESLGAVRTGFASTCLTALPFLVWRVRNRANFKSIGVLLAALGFVLTGDSRASLLIMPVLLIGACFVIQAPAQRSTRSIAAAVMVGAFLVAVAVSVPAVRGSFMESLGRFSPAETRLSISPSIIDEVSGPQSGQVDIERRLQLFVAMQSFLQHPIIGAGYQSTYAIIRDQFGREIAAHGLPSTLLGETGLLGTAIFFWMIARFFRRINVHQSYALSEQERGFFGTCKLTMLAMLLFGLFHQSDQSPILFVLLAWGYALPSTREALSRSPRIEAVYLRQ